MKFVALRNFNTLPRFIGICFVIPLRVNRRARPTGSLDMHASEWKCTAEINQNWHHIAQLTSDVGKLSIFHVRFRFTHASSNFVVIPITTAQIHRCSTFDNNYSWFNSIVMYEFKFSAHSANTPPRHVTFLLTRVWIKIAMKLENSWRKLFFHLGTFERSTVSLITHEKSRKKKFKDSREIIFFISIIKCHRHAAHTKKEDT